MCAICVPTSGYYVDSGLTAVCTFTSKFAAPVTPAVVMYLPCSSDELWPQSGVIDPSKRPSRRVVVTCQSPTSIGVVEVNHGGIRAIWNVCRVDGPVVSVLTVQLLNLGNVDRLAIISVQYQFLVEGQVT